MAELAALSLACNIFQVISFAHETYNSYQKIRESGTLDPLALVSVTPFLLRASRPYLGLPGPSLRL